MNTSQAIRLGQELDVVRDLVTAVQTSVWTRLLRDFEEAVDFLLVDVDVAR